jgi:hypothetical protein
MIRMIKRNNQVLVRARLRSHAASCGNTLIEYGVTGVLVMIVSIIGLQILNGNLSTAVAMIKDDMQAKQKNAATMHAFQAAQASGQTGVMMKTAEQALLEKSLSQKLQSSGAEGSTNVLANQMAAAAAELLAQGKITQSQYDILMQLSNQGHKMAQIEGLFSQAAIQANGDVDALSNMHYTVDGTTYSGTELATLVGYGGPTVEYFANNSVLAAASSANPETAKFLSLYQQALDSGALSDPLARSTVDSAATQIASISETVETSAVLLKNQPVDVVALNAKQASLSTRMNSSKICTAGNFEDKGALCSPG